MHNPEGGGKGEKGVGGGGEKNVREEGKRMDREEGERRMKEGGKDEERERERWRREGMRKSSRSKVHYALSASPFV